MEPEASPDRCQGVELLARLDRDVAGSPSEGTCKHLATETVEGFLLCSECAEALRGLMRRGPPWPWA